jgi:hypothetical protein
MICIPRARMSELKANMLAEQRCRFGDSSKTCKTINFILF